MTRKSMNEIANEPTTSRANDARYWSCERTCAPTSRRQTRIGSTTLHHQFSRRAREQDLAQAEKRQSPGELQRENADEVEPRALPEPHVDRCLDHRRERQRITDLAE